jgi:hypothetical protein
MKLSQKINAFVSLGRFLSQFSSENSLFIEDIPKNKMFHKDMKEMLQLAKIHNGWFTKENLYFSCKSWSEALSEKNIKQWLSVYTIKEIQSKTVALIMAGNIPLVGFHDFISVLFSGNKVLVKLSSNDKHLLPFLAKYLAEIEPEFDSYIEFTSEKIENFDAVIATGSNNSARYFEYYFGKYPIIIR